jgi:hypothetical protein
MSILVREAKGECGSYHCLGSRKRGIAYLRDGHPTEQLAAQNTAGCWPITLPDTA